jgi:hypothetical protein
MPKDKAPPGGWLPPPPTQGLKPLGIAHKADSKGRWKFKDVPQTKKDRRLRAEWNRRMEKADAKGKSHFKWPPEE